ncbi:YaiI/YqxD family protein [Shewanella sp.]|uniref:YaiI/YqxD family protein n=1 Tax=Shewanella sp. TaxID=50422 RepID=UPI003F2D6E9C
MSQYKIWVDADACPNPIKEMLFRAAQRKMLPVVLVANQPIRIPPSTYIRQIRVGSGFDVADQYIVDHVEPSHLVITADIPLAALVVEKGAVALNPRGELYTVDNIQQKLTMRDLMEELRSAGVQTGGPQTFSQADKQAFANSLDRWLLRV